VAERFGSTLLLASPAAGCVAPKRLNGEASARGGDVVEVDPGALVADLVA